MKLSEEYYIADKMDLHIHYKKELRYLVRNNRDDLQILHTQYKMAVTEIQLLECVPDSHIKRIKQLINTMTHRISFWKYNFRDLIPEIFYIVTAGYVLLALMLYSYFYLNEFIFQTVATITVVGHILCLVWMLVKTGLNYKAYKKGYRLYKKEDRLWL